MTDTDKHILDRVRSIAEAGQITDPQLLHMLQVAPPITPLPATVELLDTFTAEGKVKFRLARDLKTRRLFLSVEHDGPGPFFFPLPLAAEVTAPSLDGIEMQLADAGRYSPRKTAGC